jgi:hypothetical protein
MQTVMLSRDAVALLRHRIATGDGTVTPENRESYRELARAGIMEPVIGFVGGAEANFRFTEEGWQRRADWLNAPARPPGECEAALGRPR